MFENCAAWYLCANGLFQPKPHKLCFESSSNTLTSHGSDGPCTCSLKAWESCPGKGKGGGAEGGSLGCRKECEWCEGRDRAAVICPPQHLAPFMEHHPWNVCWHKKEVFSNSWETAQVVHTRSRRERKCLPLSRQSESFLAFTSSSQFQDCHPTLDKRRQDSSPQADLQQPCLSTQHNTSSLFVLPAGYQPEGQDIKANASSAVAKGNFSLPPLLGTCSSPNEGGEGIVPPTQLSSKHSD